MGRHLAKPVDMKGRKVGKVSKKEVEVLLSEAERAGNNNAFRYLRKLQPHTVKQIADIAGDFNIATVSGQAMGKKLTSKEGLAFTEACSPSKISALCKKALEVLGKPI